MSYAKKQGTWLALCLVAGAIPVAHAQKSDAEARMRDMLRQTTIELRDAQNQNIELRAQLEQLKAQQATAVATPLPKAPPAADTAALNRARREAEVLRGAVEDMRRAVEERDKALAQWKSALEQTEQLARTRDADAKRLDLRQQELDARVQTCERDNSELVVIANEMLASYRDKGVWDALRNAEPLTGIHRVQLETLAQQYHARIVDRQVSPGTTSEVRPDSP